jgi:hypothetical protein
LFRLRSLAVGNLVMLLMGVTMNSAFFFISLYLQQVIGYSPLRSGMAMVLVTVVLVMGGIVSRRLVPVAGPRLLLITGGLITGTGGVRPEDSGAASGLLNTSRQLGGAIGLAVLTTVAATATSHTAHSSYRAAVVHGYHIAFLVNAGVIVAAVLAALALPASVPATPQTGAQIIQRPANPAS